MAVNPMTGTFLWAERGGAGMDDSGAPIPTGPRICTEKLSILDLRITQDFLAGSKWSYRKNIKTIYFGME
jgi:hypothetical protein